MKFRKFMKTWWRQVISISGSAVTEDGKFKLPNIEHVLYMQPGDMTGH
jgi:hypothetical protein